MQTRETLIHTLDGYDAKLIQDLLISEHTRLEDLKAKTPDDTQRIEQRQRQIGDLFNALSVPAEVEAPRFQLLRTA